MNKKLGYIAIALGLIFIIGIIYLIFFHKFGEETPAPATETESTTTAPAKIEETKTVSTQVKTTVSVKKTEISQNDLARLAAAFAERFGSFSNQSDYSNIRDLKLFMTVKMQNWAENYIDESQKKSIERTIYYGITTKSVATEIKKYDTDTKEAEILVKTQRREASGTTSNTTSFNQDILIKFVQEKGAWKVDGAYWQSR